MKSFLWMTKVALVSIVSLFLVACAKPSMQYKMTLVQADLKKTLKQDSTLKHNIAIDTVQGGNETNPLWMSKVGPKEFRGALENSLMNADLYNPDTTKARYRIQASLDKVQQPILGFDFKVTSHATYRVYDNQTNKLIFEKTITTPYKAKFTESFISSKRLQLANEGSVKENLKELIEKLYEY